MTKVVLIGATGMVGQAVIGHAGSLALVPLSRRPIAAAFPAALVAPPEQWAAILAAEAPATLICCLGTTIKVAGSQAAFRAIDHDLVLAVARAAKAVGARHMILVSSVGASGVSSNFYLKTKGEVEKSLQQLGFDRLDILRPGLLKGDRPGPPRLGETLAMLAAPVTDALLHGPMRKYRSISAQQVAQAIVNLTVVGGAGQHIHEHDAIVALGRGCR